MVTTRAFLAYHLSLAFLIFFSFSVAANISSSTSRPKLSPFLLKIVEPHNNKSTLSLNNEPPSPSLNILVSMSQSGKTLRDLKLKTLGANSNLSFTTRQQKLNSLVDDLKKESDHTQKDLLTFLSIVEKQESKKSIQTKTAVHQLWITNQMVIKNVDVDLLRDLAVRSDISKIEEEVFYSLTEPVQISKLRPVQVEDGARKEVNNHHRICMEEDVMEIQWGVEDIEADKIWEAGNTGQNVVIGAIDTGVRGSHEALRTNFRQDHGWFDAINGSSEPIDDHGHGTHSIATIVGTTRGVGVAPDARWIACKGLNAEGSASAITLLMCMQWMLCPTDSDGKNADCTKAPSLVSNSWGFPPADDFRMVIAIWRISGIIPIFAIGNEGENGCQSTGSPGNYDDVIAVGSTTVFNTVSYFSSLGPAISENGTKFIKPDVVAPGSDIVSASHHNDTDYRVLSGTSMACPHVSGLVALLLSQHPALTFDEVMARLQKGAVPIRTPSGQNCGEILETEYPNNHAGYGKINAPNSLSSGALTRVKKCSLFVPIFFIMTILKLVVSDVFVF